MRVHHVRLLCAAMITILAIATPAQAEDLTRYSLEDLLALEATSVAKKRQNVADAAAAVFVITQEDIRRSGARTIPDLLRMVPGVEVGAIDGNSSAVSMRGFNTRFANSVLVLVNGRAIYVAAVSGVLWDQLLEPLNTIERIEVVRGPGAAIWGANAVNGIINIITKSAAQTRGSMADLRISSDGQDVALQTGAGNSDVSYRLTAAGRQRLTPTLLTSGDTVPLRTRGAQLGAQVDAALNANDALAIKGIVETGDFGPANASVGRNALSVGHYREANILARWSRRFTDTSDVMMQGFVDRVQRSESGVRVGETVFDLEANANHAQGRNELGVGLNYRLTMSSLASATPVIGFLTDGSRNSLISGFVQDDYWIVADRLRLTLGTKLEHTSISGFNMQPSARLLGRLGKARLWVAASRAVRTPALLERNGTFSTQAGPSGQRFYSPIPVDVVAAGSPALRTARLNALEAGIRFNIGDAVNVDFAAYHNRYDDLVGLAPTAANLTVVNGVPKVMAQYRILNNSQATSTGFEFSTSWKVTPSLRFDGYYSFISSKYRVSPAGNATNLTEVLAPYGYSLPLFPQPGLVTTPRNQGGIRAHWDILPTIEVDGWLRHVDALKLVAVPSYTTLDTRLAFQLGGKVTLSVIGQNLLYKNRLTFRESLISAAPAVISRQIAIDLRLRM